MLNHLHLIEAFRIFLRARRLDKVGFEKFSGNSEKICQKIVERCYNGKFFQTSLGHFNQFYIRDFAFSVEALLHLGYGSEVKRSLEYAMEIFSGKRVIANAITPSGKPLHIFKYSPDSLPLLLYSIRKAEADYLLKKYKNFVQRQVDYYFENVFDKNKGIVKNKPFSSIKDNAIRQSSCYDNSMLIMLSDELSKQFLYNPFEMYDLRRIMKEKYWTGNYFLEDLSGNKNVTGDAQVFPFWCKVFGNRTMKREAVSKIREKGLDNPIPLKYTATKKEVNVMFPINILLGDYETNTIWLHLGLCYLDILDSKKDLERHLDIFKRVIEDIKTFPEVLEPGGKIFKRFHYACDEGMLWAAKYLYLRDKIG